MRHVFFDESGSIGFGPGGTKFFVLAFVAPTSGKELSKCIKNINAHLIRNGWNRAVEIKASNVWHAPKNNEIPATYTYKNDPNVPMEYILKSIAKVDGYIEYAVVKLDTVSAKLRTVDNGILYNYFSLQLLKGPLCYFPAVELFVDRRNRESHHLLKFDGYIENEVGIMRAEKGRPPCILQIHHFHGDSPNECKPEERPLVNFGVRGLEAADFVCWAIKWKFENGNDKWYALIEKRIKWKQHLYFDVTN